MDTGSRSLRSLVRDDGVESARRCNRRLTTPLPHQPQQLLSIMLQLLVADAGDAAKLVEGHGPHAGDAVDGGVVQYDVGRYTALAGDLGAPRPQRGVQGRVRHLALAGRIGGKVAA